MYRQADKLKEKEDVQRDGRMGGQRQTARKAHRITTKAIHTQAGKQADGEASGQIDRRKDRPIGQARTDSQPDS